MLSALLSFAALPLVTLAMDVPLDNKMLQEPGLLRYPITVNAGAPSKNHILRRQQDVGVQSENSGFFYSIELQVGTPPQPVRVNFDTGSAELWINPVCRKSADPTFCEKLGRFNGSQTFVDTNITNRVNYGTGYAQLEYGYDYIQIGSAKISQQIFGVATDSEFAMTGIMGAGPQVRGWTSDYPFILDNMVSQKFIKSRAFALDIRSIESARGSVVFGGIDTKKFSGHLEKRPIIPATESPDKQTRYWVYLDGISVTKGDGSKVPVFDRDNGQAVLLDSGYTASALPAVHFNKIKDAFPNVTAPANGDNSGQYRVPCNVGDLKGTVNFRFGKTEINVPYKDFIWQYSAEVCYLGVTPDDQFPVLGDTFLRAAYVVYDMDNRNIHIANNEDCGSALLPIGEGPNAVPSVVGDCGKKPKSTISSKKPATTTTKPSPTSSRTVPAGGNSNAIATSKATTSSSLAHPSTTTTIGYGRANSTGITTQPATTTASGTTSEYLTTTEWQNTVTIPTFTSTLTTTKVHTITSCPAFVTGCPVGSVTTETIVATTTWCPGTGSPAQSATGPTTTPKTTGTSQESITSVLTTAKTYTIASCPGQTPCGKGKVTTEVLTSTTYLCPESTATFTVPRTHTCGPTETGCKAGDKVTKTYTVTVKPHTTAVRPTPIPGCGNNCVVPPPVQTLPPQTTAVVTQPKMTFPGTTPAPVTTSSTSTGTVTTVTKPSETPCTTCGAQTSSPPPLTAGAAASLRISALAGVVMMGVFAVAIL